MDLAQRRTDCYTVPVGNVIPQRELRNKHAAVIAGSGHIDASRFRADLARGRMWLSRSS